VLIVLANDLSKVRMGVMAGRSAGGAVQRNRAKRLLRAGMQPLLERITPGHDLVLIARAGVLATNSPEVQNTLERLLRRAKLL